jgi:hypothetical protein
MKHGGQNPHRWHRRVFFEMKKICTVRMRQHAWMCRIRLQIILEPS